MKLLFILLFLVSCRSECVKTAKIIKVGGCDKNGICGVAYSDGSSGREYFPVEGQTFCLERQWK